MTPATISADRRSSSTMRIGMVVWLASELMFFSGLFAAYYALRSVNAVWPPADVQLDTVRTAAFTVLLVSSSLTYHRAARAAEAGRQRLVIRWTVVTAALGLVFLGNQGLEYVEADFALGDHAYGSMFFLMTGFHGLHVVGGIVLMLVVLAVGAGPGSRAPLDEGVVVSEYYWHFVDLVWVAMFATIYVVK